jgi:hypothetical protein
MRTVLRHWPIYAAYGVLGLALLLGSFPRAIAGLKPHEIALLLLAVALVARRMVRRDWHISVSWIDAAFGLLVIFGTLVPLVTMEVRGMPITADAAKALLSPMEWYLWYRVFLEAVPMPRELPRLLWLLLILLSIIGLVGDMQALHVPGLARFLSLVSATHQTAVSAGVQRPTSLVGEWGLMARLCGFALLLINQLQTDHMGRWVLHSRWWRWWFVGLMAVNVLAVVASLAVEAFIALAIGYTLAYIINHRRLARETVAVGALAALSAVAIIPLLVTRLTLQFGGGSALVPATWQVRFLHWQIVLGSIMQGGWSTILFGVNPSFVYPVSQFGGTESLYWLLWYRGGLLYLLAFLSFLACVILTAWRMRQRTQLPRERSFLTWAWIILIVIGCIGVIDALFVDGGEVQLLMTIIAVIGGLSTHTNFSTLRIAMKGATYAA